MRKAAYVIVCLLFAGGITTFVLVRYHGRPSAHKHTSATNTARPSSDGTNKSGPGKKTTAAGAAPDTQIVTTINSSCASIFSLATAKKFLGSDAAALADNGITSQSASATISVCAYHAASGTARVIVHIAKTSVAASTNEVNFGSGRPAGAQTVDGYGSAAFWDTQASQLNILQNNNWFVLATVQHGTSTAAASEQLAAMIHLKN